MKNFKTVLVVLCVTLISIAFVACNSAAKDYMASFENFVSKVESDYSNYSEKDWNDIEAKYEKYCNAKYEKVKDDLKPEDEKKLAQIKARYLEIKEKIETPEVKIKPTVNVYVENSGSMDGYVKGVTEFENIIYNYLSDIKISRITDSLNLFYINSDVFAFESDTSVDADVLKDFINKLEPETFQIRGSKDGKRGTSDISEVIASVLQRTGEHDISIMITDGIFSPGKNKNADNYLTSQGIRIKGAVAEHLDMYPESMVVLYMMSSKFTGKFFDKYDTPYEISEERPFYIWVFGQCNDVVDLMARVPDSNFKGKGVLKKMQKTVQGGDLKYRVKPVSKINTDATYKYDADNKDKVSVKKRKGSRDGYSSRDGYKFLVQVDYTGLLYDDEYLLETGNYRTDDSAAVITKSEKVNSNDEYSHLLTIELNKDFFPKNCKEKDLNIWFEETMDDWGDVNDDLGERPISGKTYGIKYQVTGIYDAYAFYSKKGNRSAEMSFKVKKNIENNK